MFSSRFWACPTFEPSKLSVGHSCFSLSQSAPSRLQEKKRKKLLIVPPIESPREEQAIHEGLGCLCQSML